MSESKRERARGRAMRGGLTVLALALASGPKLAAQVAVEGGASAPERHQVADGDTLSSIAERHLGNGDAWPKLWSYNPEITNPHWIYPDQVCGCCPRARRPP